MADKQVTTNEKYVNGKATCRKQTLYSTPLRKILITIANCFVSQYNNKIAKCLPGKYHVTFNASVNTCIFKNTAISNVLYIRQPHTKQTFRRAIQVWSTKKPREENYFYMWGIGRTQKDFWLELYFLRQIFNVYGTLPVRFELWVMCFKLQMYSIHVYVLK